MKLLFFASDYKIGISSLLTDQAVGLKKAGVDFITVAGEKEQESGLYNKLIDNNIKVNIIKGLDEHAKFLNLINKMKQIIKDNDIKIVHVQNNWQLAIVSYIKYVLFCYDIKIIYTLHAFRHNNKIKSIIAQFCIGLALLLFANKVICMCNYLKKKFALLSYKIVLLPLGISDEYFTTSYIEPALDKGLQIIFPAQFRHGKNQDMIIKAFAKYINETNDSISHLYLPGSGYLLDEMKSLSKNLGIENRVTFPGQCSKSQIKDLYLRCNIAVVSSNSETFGQSIVEPYVLGRCVVSRPVGIAPDIIGKCNGYLFDNERELYSVFVQISRSITVLKDFGYNNYLHNRSFRWDEISKQYINLILN